MYTRNLVSVIGAVLRKKKYFSRWISPGDNHFLGLVYATFLIGVLQVRKSVHEKDFRQGMSQSV